MRERVDVLNLEWSSKPSRDRLMATLVCNYLRFMGLNVVEGSVFDGYSLLSRCSPKLFFICDTRGAGINFELMKYAKSKGIYGISLMAEGNFKGGNKFIDRFIWGWNVDKTLYEDINMQWTEWTVQQTLSLYPELKNRIKTSGGVGFDIYKISKFKQREEFLKKYIARPFKQIIGVGCYNFEVFYQDFYLYHIVNSLYSKNEIERFRLDHIAFREIMKKTVVANPQILFLFKEHPGSYGGRWGAGIEGLEKLPNVLILKNEENIADCINICDFWLVYDSTTSLEAWLLEKQSGLLNPSGTDFMRDMIYTGAPNYDKAESLQNAIDHFYSEGELFGFQELENNRKAIIKDTIQWDDGLNHVRAGNEIINFLENTSPTVLKADTLKYQILKCKQKIGWNVLPYMNIGQKFKHYKERREDFDPDQLRSIQDQTMEEQIDFYNRKGLSKAELGKIRCI